MGDRTGIQWTDATWNCVRGCSVVSPGCVRCYAKRQAHRFSGPGGPYEGMTKLTNHGPEWTGVVRLIPEMLDQPLRWKRPRRIFVNSMSDLFHEGLPFDDILRVFEVMERAHWHTFQVLTKRPQRMFDFCASYGIGTANVWPRNVWAGVSVENQATADERIPLLLQTPAAVRFVSAEPLLGPVNLCAVPDGATRPAMFSAKYTALGDLSWVIVGGESGPGARPMHPDWARELRDQCAAAAVPFFFKQWGEWHPVCEMTEGQVEACYPPRKHEFDESTRPCLVPNVVQHASGETFDLAVEAFEQGSGAMQTFKVGKKRAGRLLDGVEWSQFPEVSRG